MRTTFIIAAIVILSGCNTGPAPQRGGFASIGKAIASPLSIFQKPAAPADKPTVAPGKGVQAQPVPGDGMTITQPDNPGQQSQQNLEVQREEELVFAAPATLTTEAEGSKQTITIPAGSKRITKETRKAGQTIGAAQKDTARADAAWLASFQGVQYAGIIALLAAIIGFAHPVARGLVGKDTAVMVGAAGLVMIFGPAFLKEYGHWFALSLIAAGAYWFFSRAKYKEGRLDELTSRTNPPFPK